MATGLLAVLAATSAGADGPGDECFLEPAVAHYVADVQDRILSLWELPPDSMANREVVLLLTFRANGTLERARIVESNDTRLKRSVAAALQRALPFDRVPAEAGCLVGRPIRTTFRNPAD